MKCLDCYNCRPSLHGLGYICCAKQDVSKYQKERAEECKYFDEDKHFNRIGTPRVPRPSKEERRKAVLDKLKEV